MTSRNFGPSDRGLTIGKRGKAWECIEHLHDYPLFDPQQRPDGVINLMGAENNLMVDWMRKYVGDVISAADMFESFSYGSPGGSTALREAAAGFLNNQFNPSSQVESSHILATNGVTSAIDLLTWAMCDPGDAIIYPVPTFYMLDFDLAARNGVINIPVAVEQKFDGDPFAPTEEAASQLEFAFETAICDAASRGVRCRVLFLCNPANPQGRCYASATLERLAELCTRHRMHLVTDEIYAMSNFSEGKEPFNSVLSIPSSSTGNLQNAHCLYGLSKDYGVGGLRLGFIITRNKELLHALKKLSFFTWISTCSDIFATKFLSNLPQMQTYVELCQRRLAEAYTSVSKALIDHKIPFRPATSGLFVFVDLSTWLPFFAGPGTEIKSDSNLSVSGMENQELQLWQWLLDHGIAINPGQFAESDKPGWYRLVFSGDIAVTRIAVGRLRKALERLEERGDSHVIHTAIECHGPSVSSDLTNESDNVNKIIKDKHIKTKRFH